MFNVSRIWKPKRYTSNSGSSLCFLQTLSTCLHGQRESDGEADVYGGSDGQGLVHRRLGGPAHGHALFGRAPQILPGRRRLLRAPGLLRHTDSRRLHQCVCVHGMDSGQH